MNPTATGAIIAGTAGAVVALVQFLGQRSAARSAASSPDKVGDGFQRLVTSLETRLAHMQVEIDTLRGEIADCERRHNDARARIVHLEQLVERRRIDLGRPDGNDRRRID